MCLITDARRLSEDYTGLGRRAKNEQSDGNDGDSFFNPPDSEQDQDDDEEGEEQSKVGVTRGPNECQVGNYDGSSGSWNSGSTRWINRKVGGGG